MKIQNLVVGKSYRYKRYSGGFQYTTIYTITKINKENAEYVAENGSFGRLWGKQIKELEEV